MRYEVLGGIEVVGEDESVLSLGGPTQHRLLGALLVEANHTVSVDHLVEALFDGAEVENSVKAVRTYVSRLRSVVGEGTVATTSGGYRLAVDSASVDAERFAELVRGASAAREAGDAARAVALCDEALNLWRGRPFSPFSDEPWAVGDVVRLEELRWVAKEERLDARLALGAHAEVAGEAEAMTLEAPMRERPRLALMLALYRSGRHAEALRAFQTFREQLAEATGLEPSDELQRLERRIVDRDPSLDTEGRGRSIRGYELHEKIAEGAFGAIYRGFQPSVGREVAVKVVRPELADDPRFIARFEAEAQLVARLEHPHIVPLYDYWREPGGAFLVMRYLRGGSAEERLVRQGPFTLAELTQLVEQVGTALAVAHAAGVVHRDVKPANVMYDEVGNAYLGDFGIALSAAEDLTDDAFRSAGSPVYAAPEQLAGQAASIASDIYAFGVLLWELAVGHAPFENDTLASLRRTKLAGSIQSVRDSRADLPVAVDLVMRTATGPEPSDRFGDVGELVLAWRTAVSSPGRGVTTSRQSVDAGTDRPRAHASRTLVSLQEQRVNPYKGLRPFGEADAAEFFGRDATTARLVEATTNSAFIAVVGPSGSGKSSVVRAGLIPALRQDGRWVAAMVPGAHPFDELENALLRLAPGSVTSLLPQLIADERGLMRATTRILPDDDTELVLVVDQFEELFTLASAEERAAFADALVAAATDPRSRVRTVVTLRADFYDRPLAVGGLGELVRDHTVAVTPLDGDELERAITGPADRVGVSVEPALVAALVADATANPASLPLLQYTLTELYDRRDGTRLTVDAYRELGGLAGSVAGRADALCEEVGDVDAVRGLFERLVSPGAGTEDTRRRARMSELHGVPASVIEAFGDARLLAFDHHPVTREPTVEVAHEALIRNWPRLMGWLDEDRESLSVMRHLTDAADAWELRGREAGDLYRGARLAAATDLVGAKPSQLSARETEFIAASDDAAQADDRRRRRNARRLRTLTVGLAITLVGALIAGAIAVSQRNESTAQRNRAQEQSALAASTAQQATAEARTATLGRLAFQARSLAASNPSQGLLLALEADRLLPNDDTLGSLEVALLAKPALLRSVYTTPLLNIYFSPDGAVSGGTADGRIVEIDTSTGKTAQEWKVGDGPVLGGVGASGGGLAIRPKSPDVLQRDDHGSVHVLASDGIASPLLGETVPVAIAPGQGTATVAIATQSGVRLVDFSSRSVLATIDGPPATMLAFSGDGTRLAIESGVGNIAVVDVATRRTVAPPVTLAGPAGIALNNTGTRLGFATSLRAGILDVATGETLGTPETTVGYQVNLAFSTDGSLMGAVLSNGDLWIFDAATGKRVGSDQKVPLSSPPIGLGFTPDDTTLFVASASGQMAVLDLVGRQKLARPAETTGSIGTFSPDGTRFAVPIGGSDNDTAIVDVATGKLLHTLHPARRFPNWGTTTKAFRVAFSPDGQEIAIGSAAYDGQPAEIEVFSVADGRSLRRLPVPGVPFIGEPLAWSPDGRVLTGGVQNRVVRIDAITGALLGDLAVPDLFSPLELQYDEDGKLAVAGQASSGFGKAWVFDTSGRLIRTYGTVTDPYYHPAWGPGGILILPSVATGEIRLVDPVADRPAGASFTGPIGSAWVAVNSDGHGGTRGVVVSGEDMIQLWDVGTGQPIGEPIQGTSPPRSFAGVMTNAERAVVEDVDNHRMMIWDLDPAVWRVRACEAAGRNLTRDEWTKFLPAGEPYHVTCPQYPAGV